MKKKLCELSFLLESLAPRAEAAADAKAEAEAAIKAAQHGRAASGSARKSHKKGSGGGHVVSATPGVIWGTQTAAAKLEELRVRRLREIIAKQVVSALKMLLQHKWAWVFNKPVDAEALGLKNYHEVITQPMDLGTVKARIDGGSFYSHPDDVAADVKLTFANAMKYNPAGSDVHVMAKQLLEMFEQRWASSVVSAVAHAARQDKLDEERAKEAAAEAERQRTAAEAEAVCLEISGHLDTYRRQLVECKHQVLSLCRPRTTEEKGEIGLALQALPQDLIGRALSFAKTRGVAGGQETELDLNAQDALTLSRLEHYARVAPGAAWAQPPEVVPESDDEDVGFQLPTPGGLAGVRLGEETDDEDDTLAGAEDFGAAIERGVRRAYCVEVDVDGDCEGTGVEICLRAVTPLPPDPGSSELGLHSVNDPGEDEIDAALMLLPDADGLGDGLDEADALAEAADLSKVEVPVHALPPTPGAVPLPVGDAAAFAPIPGDAAIANGCDLIGGEVAQGGTSKQPLQTAEKAVELAPLRVGDDPAAPIDPVPAGIEPLFGLS